MGLLQKKWEYPECRQDGFYQSKQCTLSNDGTVDVCKCVDQNGEELSGLDSDANDCPREGLTCKDKLSKGGSASVSSVHRESSTATQAFNGEEWHSRQGMPQWIMYKLINPLPICQISYLPRHDNSAGNTPRDCPKSYRFEGSNDGITFEIIMSVHDDQACVPGTIVTKSFVNEKAFKFYRLFFLDVPGRNNGNKYVVLGDVQFFGHLAGVTENMGKGPQFVDNLKSIIDTHPRLKSAIQQLAGVTENMGKGPQFVDNLKPIMDTNPSPKSAFQQLGQLMLTWMKTTIETLMKLELELEHGTHGPSKPSSS